MNDNRGLWRGKRVDNGEWITGYYMRIVRETSIKEIIRYCIFTGVEFWDNLSGETALESYEVDPSTLGECTGLRDKNGKIIFEGDICTATNNFVDGEYGVVKYCEQEAIYTVNFTSARLDFSRQLQSETEIEVIGNIHDDFELLKLATGEDIGNAAQDTLAPAT